MPASRRKKGKKKIKENYNKEKEQPQEEQVEPVKNKSIISLVAFAFSITIVFISIIPIVFPALLVSSASSLDEISINPWEMGGLAMPLIVINVLFLLFGIAYFKNKLPTWVKKLVQNLLNFDISKKTALIVLGVILLIYTAASAVELSQDETFADFINVEKAAENFGVDYVSEKIINLVKFFLLSSSIALFDNIRVIPLIASVAALTVTYLLTVKISQKRFAGLVSVMVVIQSYTFLKYDTSATYENFWILFYLISLYSLYRIWPASPISYILSVLSKSLTVAFLPLTLFFIYRANLPKKTKVLSIIPYIAILIGGVIMVSVFNLDLIGAADVTVIQTERIEPFNAVDFWQGFSSAAFMLRFDVILLLLILPLIVGLYLASRKGVLQADAVMILIAGTLLVAPLLTGFTYMTNQPYRFVTLVFFFAIGIGTLLAKRPEFSKVA